jgi:hypothetical protein
VGKRGEERRGEERTGRGRRERRVRVIYIEVGEMRGPRR